MEKFELFLGCLGNGVTVCNKAIMEHGDFKRIAHIADCGVITWYANPDNIPTDAMKRIEATAEAERITWEERLRAMGDNRAYDYLLNSVPLAAFMHVVREMKDTGIPDKIKYLKSAYMDAAI